MGAVFIIGVNIKEGAATVDIVQRVHHWIVRRRDDGHVLAKTIQGQFHILGPGHLQRPGLDRDAQDQESAEFLQGVAVQEAMETNRRTVHQKSSRREHAQKKQASTNYYIILM